MSYRTFFFPRSRMMLLGILSIAAIGSPIIFGVLNVPRLRADVVQDPNPQSNPRFDVVSIKPSQLGDLRQGLNFNPGNMTVLNLPMKEVIKFAYGLKSDSQLLDAPQWVKSERFTIEAKEDHALNSSLEKLPLEDRISVFRKLVRQMLANRFHIVTSTRSTELPIFALVVAKSGPKMKSASPTKPGETRNFRGWQSRGPGIVEGSAATTELLASIISRMPETDDRVVIDKTGISGEYDWTLRWTQQSLSQAEVGSGMEARGSDGSPTLFTALQEQLGLKLVKQKGIVEALVIDHIDWPTSD